MVLGDTIRKVRDDASTAGVVHVFEAMFDSPPTFTDLEHAQGIAMPGIRVTAPIIVATAVKKGIQAVRVRWEVAEATKSQ